MEASHILVVHDEPAVQRLVANALEHEAVRLSCATGREEGLAVLEKECVHVLVACWNTSNNGAEFVRRAASIQPLLGMVLLVDATCSDQPPQRTQLGLIERLPQPVTKEELRAAVGRVCERQRRRGPWYESRGAMATVTAHADGDACGEHERIIAASKAMREILEVIRRCAGTEVAVLLYGEPDTGKETIAREIHRQSRRAAAPFVRVACGALRESELAEQLFGCRDQQGHGAQTPATLLNKARGGTLFLENVEEMSPWSQAMLLDVLQRGGGGDAGRTEDAVLDVRVLASTTVDLRTAVAQRSFLSRLYYYLNVVLIQVPPLRNRPSDVRCLVDKYLLIANSMRPGPVAKPACRFSAEALQYLLGYDWPGNTLQLASVVAHAVLLADGEEIGPATIAAALAEAGQQDLSATISVPLAGGLKEIERAIVEAVVERCQGNKAAAARLLRLHRRTLYRMLQDETPASKAASPLTLAMNPVAGVCATQACG
jgi:DNA-binding NtrC family response regulator